MLKYLLSIAMFLSNVIYAGNPIVIGIAGGTGSGKTTLAKRIQASLGAKSTLIEQDSYYKDWSHLSVEERSELNFDHPESLDFEKLSQDIFALKNGQPIEKPIYNFSPHARDKGTIHVEPTEIIIVEGILVLNDEKTRNLCDLKIYVQTDDDIRIVRRIERDIDERGRDFASVKRQYLKTVKPMHNRFVEPSKEYADVIVPGNSDTSVVINLIIAGLQGQITQSRL